MTASMRTIRQQILRSTELTAHRTTVRADHHVNRRAGGRVSFINLDRQSHERYVC